MRRLTRLQALAILVVGPALLLPRPAPAASGETVRLSLDEALARASEVAPRVRVAEGEVGEAEASRVGTAVRLPVNPRLQLDLRPGVDASSRGQVGWAATLEVPFEVANAAGARVAEAGARRALAGAELELARLEARLQVLQAYGDTRLGALRITQTEATVTVARRLLEVAAERLRVGAGNDIEVTSARAELAERSAELLAARGARELARNQLRFLLALPPGAPLALITEVERPGPVPGEAVLIDAALRHRPELKVHERRARLIAASEVRLRREGRPKLSVLGMVDAAPLSPVFGAIGLGIELGFAQRNQGPRAVAVAAHRTERLRLDNERRRVAYRVRGLRERYLVRLREVEMLSGVALPAAEQRLGLVETAWRAGRFDVLRVTTALQDLSRLRDKRLALLALLWNDRMLLERLVGSWPTLGP